MPPVMCATPSGRTIGSQPTGIAEYQGVSTVLTATSAMFG